MAARATRQEASRHASLFALGEDDGQDEEDVKELTATQDRVTFVSFFGDENLVMRRQKAKDAVEKEFLSFSLSKLHPFVEVVSCLVSYSEDEIAKNPKLNEFFWSCDLSSTSEEESSFHGERPIRAFEYYHDPKAKLKKGTAESTIVPPNFVVMCKFYRNHKNRKGWFFHSIGESGSVQSSITPALAESMQVFLLDIIPEIEIPNRNALTSVVAVCAALNYDEFLGIENCFPEKGIRKDDFARIILFAVMKSRPELQRVGRASALVALLFEMFEQIDINGDAWVDWEEFTTFCMSLGLIATCEQQIGLAGLYATMYRQELVGGTKARNFPYQVHKIKCFTQLKRIAVIEHKSAVILMYDSDLVLHHEMNCVEKLLGSGDARLTILDVDHVPARNILAISSSDHSITLWSIVNAATGAYMFSSKIVNRYPVARLKWCAPLKHLLALEIANSRWNHLVIAVLPANVYFVATGDDSGRIHVYDFQKLYLLYRCESHHHEIRSLHFHCQAPILISGDSNGIILVWQATDVVYTTFPLMQLACQNSTTSAPPTPPSGTAAHSQASHPSSIPVHSRHFQHTSPITSICSTFESPQEPSSLILAACESGEIYAWDYRILINVARKRGIGTHFEHQYQRHGPGNAVQTEEYNPLLRMSHKQSVLKLRPEDRNGVKTGFSHSTAASSAGGHMHVGIASCMSTFSRIAHDDVVFAVKCVPDPGVVYTFSQDSRIKVWDAAHTCIGIISTVVNPSAKLTTTTAIAAKATAQRTRNATAGQQNDPPTQPASSSAWKFTHHLSSDASHHHSRIAAEVIRKHKRQKLKAHRRSRHSSPVSRKEAEEDADLADDPEQMGMISPLTQETSKSPVKSAAKPTGIEAGLAAQAPFSADSIRAGVQQKLFGPSEAHQLKEISHNLTLMASLKKSALLPPEISPEQLRRMAKRRTYSTGNATHSNSVPCDASARRCSVDVFERKAVRTIFIMLAVARTQINLKAENEASHGRQCGGDAKCVVTKALRDENNNSRSMYSMKKRASQGMVPVAGNTGSSGIPQSPFGPFYTVKQVIEFGNIITRFDEDFSGDIDQQEWASMLQSFRPIFGHSDQEATEKLFRSLDRDDSGRISLREILPAMFSKATPEQLQHMKLFLNTHTEADDKKPKKKAPHT
ncbi:hypothetical protein FI667_g14145, partial [Globisporangium splendens]